MIDEHLQDSHADSNTSRLLRTGGQICLLSLLLILLPVAYGVLSEVAGWLLGWHSVEWTSISVPLASLSSANLSIEGLYFRCCLLTGAIGIGTNWAAIQQVSVPNRTASIWARSLILSVALASITLLVGSFLHGFAATIETVWLSWPATFLGVLLQIGSLAFVINALWHSFRLATYRSANS